MVEVAAVVEEREVEREMLSPPAVRSVWWEGPGEVRLNEPVSPGVTS